MVDYTAMDAPTLLSFVRDDAWKWAEAFMQTVATGVVVDREFMIGWFANAIEHSTAIRQPQVDAILSVSEAAMTDVSEIAERLRAVLNDGLSSVAICNKNDLRAILDDRERLMKERDEARAEADDFKRLWARAQIDAKDAEAELARLRAPVEGKVGEVVSFLTLCAETYRRAGRSGEQHEAADLIQRLAGQVADLERDYRLIKECSDHNAKKGNAAEARLREAADRINQLIAALASTAMGEQDGARRSALAFLSTLEDHSNG